MAAVLDFRPTCGGGFTPRPIRPNAVLERPPASTGRVPHALDPSEHGTVFAYHGSVPPEQR